MEINFPIYEWYAELDLLGKHSDLFNEAVPLHEKLLCRREFVTDEQPALVHSYLLQNGVPARLNIIDGEPKALIVCPKKPLIEVVPQIKPLISPDQQAIIDLLRKEEQQAIQAARAAFERGWQF